ncbi:glycosyltransferase family 4 protein [Clostridium lacusfryxellense]|uniref:glycosyltransferase family 4 protein n=1 Tax=Clostridium lacusfryxellense TaxID=205328 RepID=UPI001C0D5D1E|nr:glycosyltransferase family 4 protein [Clostridium lacusfryxellense]MBU3110759.1 glycosyltransferase family 4 protein [Clostridium lacusfryxellense]
MKKVLFTATIDSHILNFHIPYLKWFKEQGYEVHVASNGEEKIPFVDVKHNILFERSPYSIKNINAYITLKKVIEQNDFNIIHCNTPIGGVLTRLAARKVRSMGTKVIYTAHGFHFYKGASLINWTVYYLIEKWLAKYTDCLITINEEDYIRCTNNKFKAKSIKIVNGIGIDLNKFQNQTLVKKTELRKKYGYREDDFILIYVAELSYRKHQDLIIDAVNLLSRKIPNIKLLIVGSGKLSQQYVKQVNKLNLQENVHFLGYRKDIECLMNMSDIAVSSSRQEGLPVNVMEAMATGLPIVVTDVRGNRDLVHNGENGYVVDIEDVEMFSSSLESLYRSEDLRKEFGEKSLELIKIYSLENVMKEMKKNYEECMN